MATRNDITGAQIRSKPSSDEYRNNYDSIFKRSQRDPQEALEGNPGEVTCRGSMRLGSACMRCSRCKREAESLGVVLNFAEKI